MHRTIAGFAACLLAATPALAQMAPDQVPAALMKHRAELLTQCPPAIASPGADQLPIHVTNWGAVGPHVLVIHGGVQGGLGGGPATFAGQEKLGAEGWQLTVVDRPGFGESASRGPDDMERDAGWIADMLGARSHVIAHSWGGTEALLAAARRPDAVRSLILIEPALEMLLVGYPAVKDDVGVQAALRGRMQLLLTAPDPAAIGIGFARSLGSSTGDGAPNAAAAAFEANPVQAAKVGCALLQARMASPDMLRSALEKVGVAGIPVMIVTGGWSPVYDAAADLAAKLSHGRHIVIRSPSHFVQLVNSEDFNRAANSFMRAAELADHPPNRR